MAEDSARADETRFDEYSLFLLHNPSTMQIASHCICMNIFILMAPLWLLFIYIFTYLISCSDDCRIKAETS